MKKILFVHKNIVFSLKKKYYEILEAKESTKTVIDKKFEYNTYILISLKITKERH